VRRRPRLLSDNVPAYLSGELVTYLKEHAMSRIRGKPFHPMLRAKSSVTIAP